MIFDQLLIYARTKIDHLFSHHIAAIYLIRILPNSLDIFELVESSWLH